MKRKFSQKAEVRRHYYLRNKNLEFNNLTLLQEVEKPHAKSDIIIEDLSTHPCCDHGPTILFKRNSSEFYSCSAFRNRNQCSFYMKKADFLKKSSSTKPELSKQKPIRFVKNPKFFCHQCQTLESKGHEKHQKETNPELLKRPSQILKNMEDSKGQAQFHFSEESLNVIVNLVRKTKPSLILFIGAPSVFEELRSKGVESDLLVLDIDVRLGQFLSKEEFCHYNMFNHHFFDVESLDTFKTAISKRPRSVMIITDPPFGGRPELISHTFQSIKQDFDCQDFHIVWIFPYFMEPKIKAACPSLEMSDYQVTYEKLGGYKEGQEGNRNLGSPVRIFTNLSLKLIDLSHLPDQYRFCQTCQRYVAQTNRHCHDCQSCTAKNGGLYRHCHDCSRCVKFSWNHCSECGRCALPDHPCQLFKEKRLQNGSKNK